MNYKFLSKSIRVFVITITVFLVSSGPTWAGFTFIKVVDDNTIVPGETLKYNSFGDPAISNGQIVFKAEDDEAIGGIYQYLEGSLSVVADENTPVPGSSNKFQSFCDPAISNGQIVFQADDGSDAIYVAKWNISMSGIIWLLIN